jgi:amino acid adenylation domain-containing protein
MSSLSCTYDAKVGEVAEVAERPSTLIDLLRWRARYQADCVAYTFLADGEAEESQLTYAELDERARAIAATLQSVGATGERVLLLYPPGLEFIAAFFGCLYAGAVAVPTYAPRPRRKPETFLRIVADARPAAALTTQKILTQIKPLLAGAGDTSSRWIDTETVPTAAADWQALPVSDEALALIQYTSGSTSAPKGVMVSHANLMHNQAAIKQAFEQTEQSCIVSWLPLHHDMGLIGTVLQPLFVGARCVLMPPSAFLQRPARWLEAVSRFKATTSGAPNFAYDLCARRVSARDRAGLDLSSWRVAFNGAEPVRAETIERFAEAFAPAGFRREAFVACYGLAEATLLVSAANVEGPPTVNGFEPGALTQGRAEPARDAERTLVGCGRAGASEEVLVVNPEKLSACADGEVGEIWVRGRGVAQGYWGQVQQSAETFQARLADTGDGPYLRTGDLGFLRGGELFVTGRLKDLIIIRGRNLYPQDIELTVEGSNEGLRAGGGAAFSIEAGGEERLVVVQEVETPHACDAEAVVACIREAVTSEHEIDVAAVLLVRVGSVPKTTSGKVRRQECRAAYEADRIEGVLARWEAAQGTRGPLDADSREEVTRSAASIGAWLRKELAARLGHDEADISTGEPLTRYGVDSLVALELAHALETRVGAVVPLATMLAEPTIDELAAEAFRQAAASSPADATASPAHEQTGAEQPLSCGQQSLWYLHQVSPGSAAYNIAGAVRVVSALDRAALRRALSGLSARHDALRTIFDTNAQGVPVQRVVEGLEVSFEEEDALGWDEARLKERLSEEAHRPFDLKRGPAARVKLFARPSGECVLILVIHHIISDFWSLALMLEELGVLYAAEEGGVAARLAPHGSRYEEFAREQARMLAGEDGERHWEFWHKQLEGTLPVLNLPADRPRPPVQTFRGASHTFSLDAELSAALKALSRQQGVTLYTTLLAAFFVLLHRQTGQRDLLVSSPTTGRNRAGLADLVGYFVNPVVLRADAAGDQGFDAFLRQVRGRVLEAFEHQDYPFAQLVERLGVERDPSRQPLAQAMFVWQKAQRGKEAGLTSLALNEAGTRMRLGGLTLETVSVERQVAQFDLTLMMAENDGRLSGSLKYNTDLFDEGTILRLRDQFRELLRGIVAAPRQRISALPVLGEAARRQLLSDWNETRRDYERDKTLNRQFEEQVSRTPDAVALGSARGELTFAQLNARANQLAYHLRSLGVGPESRVGLYMTRSPEMLTAVVAVLKAGGAYVPLDPSYPKERVAYMLRDAGVGVVLTQQSLAEQLPAHDGSVVAVDSDHESIGRWPGDNPTSLVGPDNLAYVIYTSGSTGRPKGVMVQHRSVSNLAAALQRIVYEGRGARRIGVNAPLTFDASVKQLIMLLKGHSLHLIPEEVRGDGEAFIRHLELQGIDAFDCTPSHLEMLMPAGLARRLKAATVLVGGEPIGERLWRELAASADTDFFNVYGPTECTVDATACAVSESPERPVIGRPIDNARVYILDAGLQPVPAGVPGEVYVAGEGLARGYLNRPALTAEKFIPEPFSCWPGARLYRTGDAARFRPDGTIEFLGRVDQQVKLRGFRIELGEIEGVLEEHDSVGSAAVVVRGDATGEKVLAAYVAASGWPEPSAGELRAFLKGRLPAYMIPQAFVMLEALPLTPSGKVDRLALPAPGPEARGADEDCAPPRNPVEEVLAGIFAQVLNVERVGVNDNFFELGGHSLLATQLISQLQDIFSTDVPLLTLFFEEPTVAGLAAALTDSQSGEGDAEKIAEILGRMGQLSDEEIEAMLSEQPPAEEW